MLRFIWVEFYCTWRHLARSAYDRVRAISAVCASSIQTSSVRCRALTTRTWIKVNARSLWPASTGAKGASAGLAIFVPMKASRSPAQTSQRKRRSSVVPARSFCPQRASYRCPPCVQHSITRLLLNSLQVCDPLENFLVQSLDSGLKLPQRCFDLLAPQP